MVLASIYLYVSGSLPTTSSIKPVEVWLIFNLVYPCLIILSNVLYQVGTFYVFLFLMKFWRFLIPLRLRERLLLQTLKFSWLTKSLKNQEKSNGSRNFPISTIQSFMLLLPFSTLHSTLSRFLKVDTLTHRRRWIMNKLVHIIRKINNQYALKSILSWFYSSLIKYFLENKIIKNYLHWVWRSWKKYIFNNPAGRTLLTAGHDFSLAFHLHLLTLGSKPSSWSLGQSGRIVAIHWHFIQSSQKVLKINCIQTIPCPHITCYRYTEFHSKKYPVTLSLILSQSQAFSSESNQSQSSICVNIMVPGVLGYFLLGNPV